MLQNAYLLAKIGADAAENERNVAKFCQKIGNYPTPLLYPTAPAPAAEWPFNPRSAGWRTF